jgi:hypothetical protein
LNPKWSAAYNNLPESKIIDGKDMRKLDQSIKHNKFTVVNTVTSNNEYLDDIVSYLHHSYENLGLCVDELYTLHNRGVAGEGLLAWLTRGRELGQSFLGLTQRPAWVSQFIYSESDYIVEMSLAMEKDRKKIYDICGQPAMLEKLPEREWLWYDAAKDTVRKFGAVPNNA